MATRDRTIKTVVAGVIMLSFIGTYLAMEWAGRQPDSLVLLVAGATVLGAGYYLWGEDMGAGVDAVDDLQGGGSNDSDDSSE